MLGRRRSSYLRERGSWGGGGPDGATPVQGDEGGAAEQLQRSRSAPERQHLNERPPPRSRGCEPWVDPYLWSMM